MPNFNNAVTKLTNSTYVPVIKDSATYYGGSQMWFPKNHWYSKDFILHKYGCGTIATADMFLYLALQKDNMQSPETVLALQGANQVQYENYDAYVRSIHDQYTNTKRYLAVLGPKIAAAINAYSRSNDLGLKASWRWKLTYYDMYDTIEDMLQNDIPVILSIGPNTPNLWGKKGISFYERKEIAYQDTTVTTEEEENPTPVIKKNPYYYKPIHTNVNGHYVTVTAIIKDDVAERIMLRISSWGKQYYVNYEEYRDYIDSNSGTFTSSLVQVNKYKLP